MQILETGKRRTSDPGICDILLWEIEVLDAHMVGALNRVAAAAPNIALYAVGGIPGEIF